MSADDARASQPAGARRTGDAGARRTGERFGEMVQIVVDGVPVSCYRGETLAAALLVAGVGAFRRTRQGEGRQPLCNMGTCFDCTVTVDGALLTRSCLTPVAEGMTVETVDER